MSGEAVLLDVAAKVADGAPIDWDVLDRQANEHERRILRSLKLLAQVGHVHDTAESPSRAVETAATAATQTATRTAATRRWGRYELRECIGEGAQGAVFRAWDPQLECEVALKVLQPQQAAADRVGERILREGRALARVRHPHVVNVYAAEVHEGQIGLCMEFIRGRTLDDLLSSQGPFGAHEAVTIGVSVGRALAAVHGAGLVHRDVKTRNVMREDGGRIVLMDFGTGRDYTQLARAGGGELAGTPLYMAPEVLSGSTASQKSDIYSVGVLLYHLVSGRYPVEGRTFDEIIQAHKQGRRRPLAERRPDLPDGFIRVVDRATAPDPAQRYDTVAMLVHDLVALESSEVERVAPPRTVAQRLLVGVAGLTAAAIALTLLGFMSSIEFNVVLERTDFTSESPVEWLEWGLRSLIGPIGDVAQVVIGAIAAVFVWRLIRRVLPAVDRFSHRLSEGIRNGRLRLGVDDPATFGQLVFLAGLAYLVLAVAWHLPLIQAAMTTISDMTPEHRESLSPARENTHLLYREMLDVLVIGMGLSLYRLVRMQLAARRRNPGLVAAVAAIFVLAVILWDGPYRLLFQARFPRMQFDAQRCYDLTYVDTAPPRVGEMLMYCPDASQARVRRVAAGDPRITDTGVTESVFTTR